MEYKYNKNNGGIRIGGCGMDMGFHVLNNLQYRLKEYGITINSNNYHHI